MISFRDVEKQFVISNDSKYVMLAGKKSEDKINLKLDQKETWIGQCKK